MDTRTLYKFLIYYPVVFLRTQGFFSELAKLEKWQFVDWHTLRRLNVLKLSRLISYSKANVPAYKDLLKDVNPKDMKTIEDLKFLPFVTKSMLKEGTSDFSSNSKELFLTKRTTGGSTGQTLTILKTRYAMACELAATWRGYHWAGINVGDKQARFWGVPFNCKGKILAKVTDLVCHRKRFSAFAFDYSSMEKYKKELKKYKPDYFYGYVSMLSEFADFFLRIGQPPPFKLKAIVATSEVLHNSIRKKLESIFRTKVYNEYGCGELGSIAHECEAGRFHVSAENMIVEIVGKNGRPCNPGEMGEIVVTELNNTAMPLIRYKIGDYGQLSNEKCPCGRSLPILKHVKGRAYDTIRLEDGRMFHGEFFMYIFEDVKRKNLGVAQFQVVQKSGFELCIRIIKEHGYGELTERFIDDKIRKKMGAEVRVTFEYVDIITREKSGKMRLIVAQGA